MNPHPAWQLGPAAIALVSAIAAIVATWRLESRKKAWASELEAQRAEAARDLERQKARAAAVLEEAKAAWNLEIEAIRARYSVEKAEAEARFRMAVEVRLKLHAAAIETMAKVSELMLNSVEATTAAAINEAFPEPAGERTRMLQQASAEIVRARTAVATAPPRFYERSEKVLLELLRVLNSGVFAKKMTGQEMRDLLVIVRGDLEQLLSDWRADVWSESERLTEPLLARPPK